MLVNGMADIHGSAVFAKIHPYYFNMERGIVRLLELLYSKSAPLGIINPNTPLVSVRLRSCTVYLLVSIGIKFLVARVKLYIGFGLESVLLPNRGDLAIFSFPDCTRIFDLERSRIDNILPAVNMDAQRQFVRMVDMQEMLGEKGIAPRIYAKDQERRSYTEELCDGARLKHCTWWRKEIFREVSEVAKAIQRTLPSEKRKARNMADELYESITSLPGAHLEESSHDWLFDEAKMIRDAVDPLDEQEVFLSHGDLAVRNVLLGHDGKLVFIDWQTVGHRIKDYDVYNYHFSVVQNCDVEQVSEDTVFGYLYEALGLVDSNRVQRELDLFKLEFLVTRVKYFLLHHDANVNTGRVSRVLRQIQSYVSCFERYRQYCEEKVGAEPAGA